jgi:hypothetical protein
VIAGLTQSTKFPILECVEGKSGVAPRRKVTVFSDGVALFTGRITDIDVSYEPNNPDATTENSYVTITAADDFVLLANTFTESAITPSQELSGTRVTTILDLPEVGYPATRDIDTGAATLGGGATFDIDANTNVLTYLQSVATSEQGYFFVAANGDLTFTDRVAASFASPAQPFRMLAQISLTPACRLCMVKSSCITRWCVRLRVAQIRLRMMLCHKPNTGFQRLIFRGCCWWMMLQP